VRCCTVVRDSCRTAWCTCTDLWRSLAFATGVGKECEHRSGTLVEGDGRSAEVGDSGVGREGTRASQSSTGGGQVRALPEGSVASAVSRTLVAVTGALGMKASMLGGAPSEDSSGACTAPKVAATVGGDQEGEWCLQRVCFPARRVGHAGVHRVLVGSGGGLPGLMVVRIFGHSLTVLSVSHGCVCLSGSMREGDGIRRGVDAAAREGRPGLRSRRSRTWGGRRGGTGRRLPQAEGAEAVTGTKPRMRHPRCQQLPGRM
jgi:hypothetical protein